MNYIFSHFCHQFYQSWLHFTYIIRHSYNNLFGDHFGQVGHLGAPKIIVLLFHVVRPTSQDSVLHSEIEATIMCLCTPYCTHSLSSVNMKSLQIDFNPSHSVRWLKIENKKR